MKYLVSRASFQHSQGTTFFYFLSLFLTRRRVDKLIFKQGIFLFQSAKISFKVATFQSIHVTSVTNKLFIWKIFDGQSIDRTIVQKSLQTFFQIFVVKILIEAESGPYRSKNGKVTFQIKLGQNLYFLYLGPKCYQF